MDSSANKSTFLNNILSSAIFSRIMQKAPKVLQSNKTIMLLLQNSLEKVREKGVGGFLSSLRENIILLVRMIKAQVSGEYDGISSGTLLKIVGGLIYFVSPSDFIPDFIPFIGFSDDIALISWILNSLGDELDRFNDWHKGVKTIEI